MEICAPYIKEMASPNFDKAQMRERLLQHDKSLLYTMIAMMEAGRSAYMCDHVTQATDPIKTLVKHKRATKANHTEDVAGAVDYILTKILLHHYMRSAVKIFSLDKKEK
jgi:hypothetical protein